MGLNWDRPHLAQELILGWTLVSLLMLIPTFFLLPSDHIREASEGERAPLLNSEEATAEDIPQNSSVHEGYGAITARAPKNPVTWADCRDSICSLSFLVHVFYGTMMGMDVMIFNADFHTWNNRVTKAYPNFKANLSDVYGYCQLPMLILGPITGLMMDRAKYWASRAENPEERARNELTAGVPALLFCWTITMLMMVCTFFDKPGWLCAGLALYILVRPTVNAVNPGYLKIRFKKEHFNYLVAMQGTVITVFGLVQLAVYGMMLEGYFIQAMGIIIAITAVSILNPLHLFCLRP